MSYFLFNGISSRDLGLIITEPVVRPSWSQMTEEATSLSATSKIIQQFKTYDNAEFTISTVITDTATNNIHSIYQALNGFGVLQLSANPEEYMNVKINPLLPEAVALAMAKLIITVQAFPFAYAVEPTSVDLTAATSYTEVNNRGTVFSEPEFRFTPTAAQSFLLNANGGVFRVDVPATLVNKEIIVDCAAQVTYYLDDNNNKVSINYLTYNNYPLLHTGMNYCKHDGGISALTVNVRERWL